MPRDIPVGNGQMLVTFDQHYRVRDLYFPHVGQENHAGGGPLRFGVWAKTPETGKPEGERRKQRVYWTDDGWDIDLRYQPDTLATAVTLEHPSLQLKLECTDAVDFHRNVLIRRIDLHNPLDHDREVRLLHHNDLHLYGTKVGDTAYFDPQLRSLIHYRKHRYIMSCFYLEGEQQTDEYACGTAGFGGAEGTWRDAEDGKLGGSPVAQGAVDSTMLLSVQIPAGGTRTAYLVLGCGHCYDDLDELHQFLHRVGPQGAIDRTVAYWKLWLAAARPELQNGPADGIDERVMDLARRSLLVVRTQIDNGGAIIAANDSDIMQFQRDTYSYLWPRDGALVADALDAAGFQDVVRNFFTFSAKIISKRGMFLHKYNPDGSPASSWHPWVDGSGKPQLPIQEDETALVVWALWRHFVRYRDIEFVRPLWVRLVQPAADFMCRYRDPDTGLPLPSYDLWEERFGVHAFTVATVHGALEAARQFAHCFGDEVRARRYGRVADEVRAGFCEHMWSEEHGRFVRRVEHADPSRVAEFISDVLDGRDPTAEVDPFKNLPAADRHVDTQPPASRGQVDEPSIYTIDPVLDASMYAIFAMGLLPVEDERVDATMSQIEQRLTVKTDVGGVARYEDDYYHQVSQNTDDIPGNPWFICTLWMADWHIAKATTAEELAPAAAYLRWVSDRCLPSGVLAEQVHPETNDPLSVSPLTWSHATVVATLLSYLQKMEQLTGDAADGFAEPTAPPHRQRKHRRVGEPVPALV
jgi:GH15 family glucan-1,4-alpha-glucosidase